MILEVLVCILAAVSGTFAISQCPVACTAPGSAALKSSLCSSKLGYPVCVWNSKTQESSVVQGMNDFEEYLASQGTNATKCKDAYLSYLCSITYSKVLGQFFSVC